MRQLVLTLGLCLAAVPALAQDSLLTASPIPEGAENRFCYYAGLAYSRNAYILIGSGIRSGQVSGTSLATVADGGGAMQSGAQFHGTNEQKPLECVLRDDGTLGWASVATVQIGK